MSINTAPTPTNDRTIQHASHAASIPTGSLIQTSHPGPMMRGLLADWEAATRNPRALRRANSWGLPGGPVDRLDEIVVRAGFGGPQDSDEADTSLLHLVRLAATDRLAAQIVLHRVLPPVIGIARRRGKRHTDGIEGALGDLLTQAWFVITCYPVERRPRKVASNIVRDIEYFEFVSGTRSRRTRVDFIDHAYFTSGAAGISVSGVASPPDADEVRNFLIDLKLHDVSATRIEIMRLTCEGWRGSEIGQRLGINERTVRWHKATTLKIAQEFSGSLRNDVEQGAASSRDDAA
jgi:hypothetical protein